MEYFDPVLLARIQFAFTISFHIIFPAFTIGLASYLMVLEGLWLKTDNAKFKDLYKFWIKIFAVAFGMGVVSGVVMSYQFGTNWSIFSDKTSNVLGPLLGYEVLTAFFLEASFLGIMLFGWGRVSKKMHFASTCIVAIGTLISAFWILAANSWMQTPQGYEILADGRIAPTSWLEIIFNPSFPYRFTHMIMGAYITTAFVVGGVGAYYLLKRQYESHAKIMLKMAVLLVFIAVPFQIYVGDSHGLNTLKYQPEKIAAMEGVWETEKPAALRLFAIPDQKEEKNLYEIAIPKLASIILTHSEDGEIRGLKSFAPGTIPPVIWVFWSFRVMVGIGLIMLFVAIASAVQYYRKKLFSTRWLKRLWVMMIPSGFVAILAGWFVTEIGRQPYTVYGVLRTVKSVTPAIVGPQVAWSLLGFVIIYCFVFGSGMYYMISMVRKGLKVTESEEQMYKHSKQASVIESKKAR